MHDAIVNKIKLLVEGGSKQNQIVSWRLLVEGAKFISLLYDEIIIVN
jgi:hypothetical protein